MIILWKHNLMFKEKNSNIYSTGSKNNKELSQNDKLLYTSNLLKKLYDFLP